MCVSPIILKKEGKYKPFPCGKCVACVKAKQNEYASRLYYCAAYVYKTMHFLTLTYRNDTMPLMLTTQGGQEYVVSPEMRDYYIFEKQDKPEINRWTYQEYNDGTIVCPSLRRQDVKDSFKRARERYFRKHKKRTQAKYFCSGEYGERTLRPHYHLILFDADPNFINFLVDDWSTNFGFVSTSKINHYNLDSVGKVAVYVSKYMTKGPFDNPNVENKWCEAPRPQSSSNLLPVTDQMVRHYTFEVSPSEDVEVTDEQLERIYDRLHSFVIGECTYKVPAYIRNKVFKIQTPYTAHERVKNDKGETVDFIERHTFTYKSGPLQKKLQDYAQRKFDALRDRKLEELRRFHPDKTDVELLAQIFAAEEDDRKACGWRSFDSLRKTYQKSKF